MFLGLWGQREDRDVRLAKVPPNNVVAGRYHKRRQQKHDNCSKESVLSEENRGSRNSKRILGWQSTRGWRSRAWSPPIPFLHSQLLHQKLLGKNVRQGTKTSSTAMYELHLHKRRLDLLQLRWSYLWRRDAERAPTLDLQPPSTLKTVHDRTAPVK